MMNLSIVTIGVGFLAGIAAGLLHFGGLWLSLRALRRRGRHPAWLLGSFLLRLALTGGVIWLVVAAGGGWGMLLGCLLGFLATRSVAVRIARPVRTVGTAGVATSGGTSA